MRKENTTPNDVPAFPADQSIARGDKRALFLFPSDRMGGAERVTRMIAKEAAISGNYDHVDCFILCRSRTGTLDELEKVGNVALHYTLAENERGGLAACLRILTRYCYSLVFSSHAHINALCSLMRWCRILHTQWLVSRESTLIFERNFGRATPIFRGFYKLYGAQDLIICQTERMLKSFNKNTNWRHQNKSKVLPNPIDLDRIAMAVTSSAPEIIDQIELKRLKIVWCGRLVPVKAPLRAIETLRALHDRGDTDAHLVMIGDGPLKGEVEAAIERLELIDYVTLSGFHPSPATIMARCDIGLLTSDIEGFPNVILEMLASGVKSVVTTDCAGGLAEIPGICVIEDAEPFQLAQALVNEMLNPHCDDTMDYLATREVSRYFTRIFDKKKG